MMSAMKAKSLRTAVVIALAGVLYLTPAADAQGRVVVAGGGPVYVARPGWYGYAYGPGWGPGYWGPGYYGPYYRSNAGTVKIETHRKDAEVFVDGGFAGPVAKMKKFDLPSGNHDISLRDSDHRTLYEERVHVIPGKTVKIQVG
jgi:hypothetical protein